MNLALQLIEQEKKARTGILDLGNCGLSELPDELFTLKWLEELTISNEYWDWNKIGWIRSNNQGKKNELSEIPMDIGQLKVLKILRMSGGKDSKSLISNLTPLQQLTQLNTLDLSSNQISEITPLQELRQLATLDLFNNQISELTPLQKLTQLTTLYLSENKISNIVPLQKLTQLTTLYLRACLGLGIR